MKLFDTIVNEFSELNVNIAVNDNELTILNQTNGNNLSVFKEEYGYRDTADYFIRYTVCFSTQHRDFDTENEDDDSEKIIEYLRLILNDKVLPLEFYKDGKPRFGGEIESDDLDKLSVSFLSKKFGYTNDYLPPFDYEIHSWSGAYDTGLRQVSALKP